MSVRLGIAVLVGMMLQAVLFGIGAVLVLATPLKEVAMQLMPWVVGRIIPDCRAVLLVVCSSFEGSLLAGSSWTRGRD